MKITEIKEDPEDKDMNIVHYELMNEEKIMLADLSVKHNKTIPELIREGFMNSADNFKKKDEDNC